MSSREINSWYETDPTNREEIKEFRVLLFKYQAYLMHNKRSRIPNSQKQIEAVRLLNLNIKQMLIYEEDFFNESNED